MKFNLLKVNLHPHILTSDISPRLLCPHIFGQLLSVNANPHVLTHNLSPKALSPDVNLSLLEVKRKRRRKREILKRNAISLRGRMVKSVDKNK